MVDEPKPGLEEQLKAAVDENKGLTATLTEITDALAELDKKYQTAQALVESYKTAVGGQSPEEAANKINRLDSLLAEARSLMQKQVGVAEELELHKTRLKEYQNVFPTPEDAVKVQELIHKLEQKAAVGGMAPEDAGKYVRTLEAQVNSVEKRRALAQKAYDELDARAKEMAKQFEAYKAAHPEVAVPAQAPVLTPAPTEPAFVSSRMQDGRQYVTAMVQRDGKPAELTYRMGLVGLVDASGKPIITATPEEHEQLSGICKQAQEAAQKAAKAGKA